MDTEIQYQKLRQIYRQLMAINPKSEGILELIEKVERDTRWMLNKEINQQIEYGRTNQ